MPELEYREICPFCKSKKLNVLKSIALINDKFAGCLNIKNFNGVYNKWMKCDNCDLRFSSISMNRSTQKRLYKNYRKIYNKCSNPSDYFQKLNSLPNSKSENIAKIEILSKSLNNYNLDLSNFKNILDCGCGAGNMLFKLAQRYPNLQCYGCEPTPEFAKYANSILYNKIINCYIEDFKSDLSFDLITLFHVFEHLIDPFESIKKLITLLSDSGYLYIVVPSIIDFDKKNDSDERFMIQHLYYYSEIFMRKLIECVNLELVEAKENISIRGKYDSHYLFRLNSQL